jgi:hypothetical protein
MKELTPEKKVHNVYLKLFTLASILSILLALGFHFVRKQQLTPIKPSVLGEQTHKPSSINIIEDMKSAIPMSSIQTTFADIQSQALSSAQNAVTSLASGAGQMVSNAVIDTAIKPLIDKINALPEAQKNEIKAQICK